MRTATWPLVAVVLALAACATKQGTDLREVKPPPPPAVPESWDFEDAATRQEHRDTMLAACKWLLDVAPATANSKQWIRTRDFALDWIEATREPEIPVTQPIVAYAATDRRFLYSAYVRGAYQCGKAEYVLAHPDADPRGFAAELAGIDGMRRLEKALRRWDPHTRSRRLAKLERKRKRNELEPFLTKLVAKNKGGGGNKRRR